MSEWINIFFTSVAVPTIIAAGIGYLSVRAQIKATRDTEQAKTEAEEPVQAASISDTQSNIYNKLYDSLQKEIARLQVSNTREQAELKKDYETQIRGLKEEIVRLKEEVVSLKTTVEKTYSQEVTARNAAITTLQAEVAELKRTGSSDRGSRS